MTLIQQESLSGVTKFKLGHVPLRFAFIQANLPLEDILRT